MKYHCLFAGWTEYRPGERDRSKKEAVRLVISAGFFVVGPVFRLINLAGSPEKGSFSGVKQPGERDRSKKEAVRLVVSAGFFVVCMKKCLLVTQRHDLYCMQEVEEWKWKKPFP